MKLILCLALLYGTAVHAEDWKIDQKTRDECAKVGGCLLTLPDGHLIPAEALKQMIDELRREAFEAGVHEGSKSCKRTNI